MVGSEDPVGAGQYRKAVGEQFVVKKMLNLVVILVVSAASIPGKEIHAALEHVTGTSWIEATRQEEADAAER
jgi:hypothetical protein